jgi:hypothetical protein
VGELSRRHRGCGVSCVTGRKQHAGRVSTSHPCSPPRRSSAMPLRGMYSNRSIRCVFPNRQEISSDEPAFEWTSTIMSTDERTGSFCGLSSENSAFGAANVEDVTRTAVNGAFYRRVEFLLVCSEQFGWISRDWHGIIIQAHSPKWSRCNAPVVFSGDLPGKSVESQRTRLALDLPTRAD